MVSWAAMYYDDTIAAIATPPGEGGIGVVRVSGAQARAIAEHLFRPQRPGPLKAGRLRYGHLIDTTNGTVVDEVLVSFMAGPRSFTREDVVEISCHGGPLPLQRALALALGAGARLATPGEFTMRAFLNGRIDLAQAEASLDVIRARTSAELQLAQEQLGGWLGQAVHGVRDELLPTLAYLTALVDFPEDEVEPQEVAEPLAAALARLEALLATADQGLVYRQGARAVLVGRPNAGKSSLLNALLRAERAIVTPIAGTTRDTLEETASIDGLPVVLIDTAGIAETDDEVERIGVARSQGALRGADLALLLIDSSRPLHPDDTCIAALTHEKPTLLVRSKADLPLQLDATPITSAHPRLLGEVSTALPQGTGLDALRAALAQALLGGVPLGGAHLVSNPRHADALKRAAVHLRRACDGHAASVVPDLLSMDVTAALHALGEISGESVGEDLLAEIFSRFCIGK
jgi:tRNA modification GTPase